MNQKISGFYKGVVSNPSESRVKRTELELRVDVDGAHSLNVISGDFYAKSKSARKYLSSFIFQGVKKIETPTNRILLIGDKGKFSSNSSQFTDIKITISANSHPPKSRISRDKRFQIQITMLVQTCIPILQNNLSRARLRGGCYALRAL